MRFHRCPRVLLACFATFVALSCGGCVHENDDGDDSDESDDTGLDDTICLLEEPFICQCLTANSGWVYEGVVGGTPAQAYAMCFTTCSAYSDILETKITPVACAEYGVSKDCSDWSPPREVSYDSSDATYSVDHAFVASLVEDPEPLWACDDATVAQVAGGFEVANADPGEFLHELGLRDGDLILSLNGHRLSSVVAVALAFSDLWSGGATSFVLKVQRDVETLNLAYSYR